MEQDAFEIGVWCHFFPREGNEQPLVQNLPTVKGDFWLEVFKMRPDVFLNEVL